MTRFIFSALLCAAIFLAFTPAYADVLEDAKAAIARGERNKAAVLVITAAAKQGDVNAQLALVPIYDLGIGVPKSPETAFRWLQRAADQNHPEAQYLIGEAYKIGQGVLKDEVEGLKWRRLGAASGYTQGQVALGYEYTHGIGVQHDESEGAMWLRKAADQGHPVAQNFLGESYAAGKGVPRDDHAAQKLFRAAAEKGIVTAQFNLGMQYLDAGSGVKNDAVLGYMWLDAAAAQGDKPAAIGRDNAAKHMSPDDIKRGQAAAKACTAAKYKNCEPG